MTDPHVTVVVPVLNEAGNIGPLVDEIERALTGVCAFEVMVVDDGSDDGSGDESDGPGRDATLVAAAPAPDHVRQVRGHQERGIRVESTADRDARRRWAERPDLHPRLPGPHGRGRRGLRPRPRTAARPQGHDVQAAAVSRRQRGSALHPAGRDAGHRLRLHLHPAPCLSRPAVLRRPAPVPPGARAPGRLHASPTSTSSIGRGRRVSRNTGSSIGSAPASST